MTLPWRPVLAALRFEPDCTPRLIPAAGIVLGLYGAAIYWLAAQLWPSSIAVILSLFATTLGNGQPRHGVLAVFFPLVKYNALMALSAANSPLGLPENLTLGLIMVAGHAASRALAVALLAASPTPSHRVTTVDLGLALIIGLSPACLLGIPGLIGLAAAIALHLGITRTAPPSGLPELATRLDIMQNMTEIGFYLGALAAWKYV